MDIFYKKDKGSKDQQNVRTSAALLKYKIMTKVVVGHYNGIINCYDVCKTAIYCKLVSYVAKINPI